MTGTYGAIATGVVNVPVQIGNQTIERLQLFISPHVNDSLTLGRDVMSRISVRQGRLLLTLYDGEVIDTLAEDPFRLLFEVTYIDEGEDWQIEEAEQLHDVHGVKDAVMVDQSHKTPGRGVAPSILEDPTFIQVEESLQQHKGAEPRMWSTDRGALSARSDVDQKGAMGPYIPSFSATESERSKDDVAKSARTLGEVQFGDAESVDEWMHPSPVLGVVAESTDRPTTPPPLFQLERNQLDLSLESTDGKMTPTCAELMETAELSDSLREASLPFDSVLDTVEGHLQQTTESSVEERLQQLQEVL